MTATDRKLIVVMGATGRQGGAVVRSLLPAGWLVRAVTRRPLSPAAKALTALGADVVQADMDNPASLQPVFSGAHGVYSVQNPYPRGAEVEIRQGRDVADAAKAAGVRHLIYGSAGTGKSGTGIPSWESKLEVERHMRQLGLPFTILRPMAFMELMTDKAFMPSVSAWHLMPALIGPTRQLVWLSAADLGIIAAKAFADPDRFIGQDLKLASDQKSLAECRAIYQSATGKKPAEFPMPAWLFARFGFVGKDLTTMWRWLRTAAFDVDLQTTRNLHPAAHTVESYLRNAAPG